MSKFKKLYRDFFGWNEETKLPTSPADIKNIEDATKAVKGLGDAMKDAGLTDLEEAQLVNNITDYNGHVIYQLRDPQEAVAVAKDIQRWTAKKGFTIIKHEKSASGRTGYFYFRVGEDPGAESQKIQGYFAQMPELVKFVFKAPSSRSKQSMQRRKI